MVMATAISSRKLVIEGTNLLEVSNRFARAVSQAKQAQWMSWGSVEKKP